MFLINGLEQDVLAANDRAIQFGDGCFTTARIVESQVQMLPATFGVCSRPAKS
ncbi:Aminodeoxychorismate lyase [Raoultella terrigena]|uniref:Aminodeoxychorismate lyase n=1 Tax=Raoultella terrigena TaxID=577 RepID=A0A485BAV5_RAOTE|nr:Aminodeoxychorismate lyase [Raoultella terrigena]